MRKSGKKQTPAFVDLYDFDHTIYRGDCTLQFYFFCVKKNPALLRFLPYQVWHTLKFILKLESRTNFKSNFFIFLRGVKDVNHAVELFWKSHLDNIKDWYTEQGDHSNDVIISASPEFLLEPVFEHLKAKALIATYMDTTTGKIIGKNCRKEEKVVRYRKLFGDTSVRKAYGDSLADRPILALAKERYLVKGNIVTPLKP
jgi:phosphatidylglycerophosphatase C